MIDSLGIKYVACLVFMVLASLHPFFLQIQENKEGLELLKIAIAKAGYTRQVSLSFFSFIVVWRLQYIKGLELTENFHDYIRLSLVWMLLHLNFMDKIKDMT